MNGLEVADQQHAEVAARGYGATAPSLSIVWGAKIFYEAIETVLAQDGLKTVIESMPLGLGHFVATDPHPVLPVALLAQPHETSSWLRRVSAISLDFSTACYGRYRF
jgi:hypothetical protein